MSPLTVLVAVALAGPEPATIEVRYTVQFDVPGMLDALCPTSGLCDCTVTWAGTGTRLAAERKAEPGLLTFEGTWAKVEGGCHDALELWSPTDGKAFHTLRLSPDGRSVVEWIAHRDRASIVRLHAGAKASGQVWLAEMAAPLGPSGVARHEEKASGDVGGMSLGSTHTLVLTLK